MQIRKATIRDIDDIMPVFDAARLFMQSTGNPHQWINGYPSKELIISNIQDEDFYLCFSGDSIVGAFYFRIGDDPTYDRIYNGLWLNDKPYGVVHRLASNGKQKRLADLCFDWCFNRVDNIRVDTHRDNKVMQSALERYGFRYCGIIYLADGRERMAYQKSLFD
ncbi:MAG: GNAT family N-acetyltransferase [Tannerella sp.]|jgi:RimJ/RimL family protein N-acetyltransferase|nr:GNAT family N-acetyltransferase [Tannerella sp.]